MPQFDTVVLIHLLTLAVTFSCIVFADTQGYLWVTGRRETLNKKTLDIIHRCVGYGLYGMIATGALLFWPLRDFLPSEPTFRVKMFFVLALVINAYVIEKHMSLAYLRPFATLTLKERSLLFTSGAVSSFSWIGAALCGYLIS